MIIHRSNRPEEFCEKVVLRNFAKFTGKHLCQSLLLNKVAGLRLATLLKKRPWHRCFPVNFAKFLRTLFSQNTSGRLLLNFAIKIPNQDLLNITSEQENYFVITFYLTLSYL